MNLEDDEVDTGIYITFLCGDIIYSILLVFFFFTTFYFKSAYSENMFYFLIRKCAANIILQFESIFPSF